LAPQYESKAHTEIGQMLNEYGIPFFYREPLLVQENRRRRIRRADFILPTYNNVLIEYILHPNQAERSKDIYRENNITALFLDEQDLAEPNWKHRLYENLEEIYHQPISHLANSYFEQRY
jgi:hypothetical protein